MRRQTANVVWATRELEYAVGAHGKYLPTVRTAVDRFAATACVFDLSVPRRLRTALAALLPAVAIGSHQGNSLACVSGAVPPIRAGMMRFVSTDEDDYVMAAAAAGEEAPLQ